MAEFIGTEEKVIDVDEPVIFENKKVAEWKERMMPKFDPLRFIADHAGLSLADAISESYRQGQQDTQPEHLTDDDFETIRIHLSAYKEKLGNQHRWEEAEEYQRIIDRFMSFASTQLEIVRCKDCIHRGEKPIADGRYWCEIHDTFMYYCSDAERRADDKQRRN